MRHPRFTVSVFGFVLILLVGTVGRGLTVRAHAELERSEPAANAVISTAPAEVHLWFSEELFKRTGANVIEVTGPDGAQVDQGDTRIDDDDRKHAIVSLKPRLTGGVYTVRWHNTSVEDGHEGSGEFIFTVDPAASDTTPQAGPPTTPPPPAPATIPASTPTPAPIPPPPASGGLSCLGGLLLGGAFLGTRPKRGPG
ncbi:MAG: copper resistance protein CopC [Anaerolineae bacterium]